MTKIAVVYYSATGHLYKMADAVAKGAADAGAEVRLRRVPEFPAEEVIRRQDAWREHHDAGIAASRACGTSIRSSPSAVCRCRGRKPLRNPRWRSGRRSYRARPSHVSNSSSTAR